MEWVIPFSNVTGVTLAAVGRMYIGVGDRDEPRPGGDGQICIDDIRITNRTP